MKYLSKLTLLFFGVTTISIVAVLFMVWTSNFAEFNIKRTELAHNSYQSHLALSSHTYELFKEFGDAMIIGDRDQGKLENELINLIQQDLAAIRNIIGEEIQLVGEEEIEELELLSNIEIQIDNLLAEYKSIIQEGAEGSQSKFYWQRLSNILDREVNHKFKAMIKSALIEEQEEVDETNVESRENLAFVKRIAIVLAVLSIAMACFSVWLLVGGLRSPITRLNKGVKALAEGNLNHRIEVAGNTELDNIARAFNQMTEELEEREQMLKTSNQQLEKAVDERTAELENILKTMESSDQERRQLLADVSHELRTPLTIIRGEADVTLRGGDKSTDEYRVALSKVKQAAEHTAHIVDDLLFIARRDSGQTKLNLKKLDLCDFLPQVIENSSQLVNELTEPVRFYNEPGSAVVNADPVRLRQVLVILIENAVRYGGSKIEVKLMNAAQGYLIQVNDDGPGLPTDEIEKVFQRFFRGSNAANYHGKGTGLGLPVAKAIIEAHNGDISIKSEHGQGLSVNVHLPAKPLLAVA